MSDQERINPPLRQSFAMVLIASACWLLLLVKFALIWRINVNWDEFLHLSHVYEASRNETTRLFQLAFTHLFQWLTSVGSDELDQIRAGRVVAWLCLGATAVLLARLASRWASASAAWLAPFAFLAVSPVLRHGASFRADSWLAPLTVLVLVLVTGKNRSGRRVIGAGAVFGLSFVISVKAVLMLPLFVVFLLAPDRLSGASRNERWRERLCQALYFFLAAAVVSGGLLLLHWLTLPPVAAGALTGFAVNAASTTLLEVPIFPRLDYFLQTLRVDWFCWLLVFAGFVTAALQRRYVALCILSLAPLLVYRNAFPYYYVVMLAPASVLVALLVESLKHAAEERSKASHASWVPVAVCLPLAFQAAINLQTLRYDGQEFQQLTISAAHEIFPEPVPYIDHSGMLASFRKVNFFMSSWGTETYLRGGESFMRAAMDVYRPPLLLANSRVLMPESPRFFELLEEDRRLIETYYVPYWGAISVAGAAVELDTDAAKSARLPFPGRYRLMSAETVLVDGIPTDDGAVIDMPEHVDELAVTIQRMGPEPVTAKLVWAEAEPPPAGFLPRFASLYEGL